MNRKHSLKPVKVYLEFGPKLQDVTGTAREVIQLSDGTPFVMFLQAVLESYPGIIEFYSANALSFSVNGFAPRIKDTLSDHDVVTLLLQSEEGEFFELPSLHYRH